MPSVRQVEQALLRAGEPRASSRTDGFQARALRGGTVIVRWQARRGADASASDVAMVEAYAPILRAAGFNATVKADVYGVRVVCLPSASPRWRATIRRRLQAVG